jgi:flagellar biosynthesis regulator FlaF
MSEQRIAQLEDENAELRARLLAQQQDAEKLAIDAVAAIESSAKIWRELVSDLRQENAELQIYRQAIESGAAQLTRETALEMARQILEDAE